MQKLDKNRFALNLRFLAQQKGVKLGELETGAGVSVGYISRLSKSEDNASSSLVDLATYSSERFGVSLNTLLQADLSSYLPNELYLSKFIAKMEKKTAEGLLNWTYTTKATILSPSCSHPGTRYNPDDIKYFKSAFNAEHSLGDGSVYADIGQNLIYIVQILKNADSFEQVNGYEVYLSPYDADQEDDAVFYACENDKLYPDLDRLFKSAMEASHQIKIYPNTRNVIDKFMKEDEYLAPDDDLPF